MPDIREPYNWTLFVSRGSIVISDPWDVATTIGSDPLEGNIDIAVGAPSRFQFDRPVLVNGAWMTCADITARHVGSTFTEASKTVPANIILRSDDHTISCATIGAVSIG
jgi:hypothetical protein